MLMRRERRAASTVTIVTAAIPAEPTRKLRRLSEGLFTGAFYLVPVHKLVSTAGELRTCAPAPNYSGKMSLTLVPRGWRDSIFSEPRPP